MLAKLRQVSSINNLPEEMLLMIIKMLAKSDLKNAVLVCQRWCQVATEPRLWTDFRFSIDYRNVKWLREMMNCPRLSAVRGVKFFGWSMPSSSSEFVLREISKRKEFEELIIRGNGLTFVDQDLLSSTLNRMKRLRLSMSKMTREQMDAFFTDMDLKTSVEELVIEFEDLSKVNPTILSNCIGKIPKTKLIKTHLSKTQRSSLRTLMEHRNLERLVLNSDGSFEHQGFTFHN